MKYNKHGIPEHDNSNDWLNDYNMHKVYWGVAIGITVFILAYVFLK